MELKWLEDYLALAEHGSFSKAAEARYVTQPAFGRRIKSLENWLGIELIDRHHYPTTLTAAGTDFVKQAQRWVTEFYQTRSQMRDQLEDTKRIVLVTQHSLTVTFLPHWIKTLQPIVGDVCFRINPYNLHDCLDSLISDQGDFLISYYSPEIFPQLESNDFLSVQIGSDTLIPVSRTDEAGEPLHSPAKSSPIKLLRYPDETFFGRLLQRDYFSCIKGSDQFVFNTQCENALVDGLTALAIEGNGMAWLPESGIKKELESGVLVKIEEGLPAPKLKVMLYRRKQTRISEIDLIWDFNNVKNIKYEAVE